MTVTIHVQDQSTTGLAGVKLQLFKNDVVYVGFSTTDSHGDSGTLTLAAGNYSVDLTKPKVMFTPNPANIVVTTATTQVITITAEVLTITQPAAAPKCKLYGTLLGSDGRGLDTRVVVETVGTGANRPFIDSVGGTAIDSQSLAVVPERREVRPDEATGYFETDLVQGTMVRVYIPEMRYEKTFRVPDVRVLELRDIRQDPGPSEVGMTSDTPATQLFRGNG